MTMNVDREQVRAQLHADGERDFVELWPEVMAQRAAFLAALAGLSDEQARWRPGTGEGEEAWSIIEVSQHLLGWSRNVAAVIEATGHGRTEPKLPPGYLDPDPGITIAQVRADLTGAALHFLTAPERLPDRPDLATTVEHRAFGPLNCRMWFAMAKVHDGDHTLQVERLRQTEGFPR